MSGKIDFPPWIKFITISAITSVRKSTGDGWACHSPRMAADTSWQGTRGSRFQAKAAWASRPPPDAPERGLPWISSILTALGHSCSLTSQPQNYKDHDRSAVVPCLVLRDKGDTGPVSAPWPGQAPYSCSRLPPALLPRWHTGGWVPTVREGSARYLGWEAGAGRLDWNKAPPFPTSRICRFQHFSKSRHFSISGGNHISITQA